MSSDSHPTKPFAPGPWTPEHFFGRAAFCRRFYERIASCVDYRESPHEGRHFEVTGMPGIGRTSLLRFLAHPDGAARRHAKHLPPAFETGGGLQLLPVLVEFEYRQPSEHPFIYLWRHLVDTVRTVDADLLEITTASGDLSRDPSMAADSIRQVTGNLRDSGWLCFLLLDDFDQALLDDIVTEKEARKLGQWRTTNSMILAGRSRLCDNPKLASSSVSTPAGSFEEPLPSSFLRSLESETLVPLQREEAFDCLLSRSQNRLSTEDADLLYRLTGGHPDLLLRAAGELWDLKLRMEPAGLPTNQRKLPEFWIKARLKAQHKGLLADIAGTAIDDELRTALRGQMESGPLDSEQMLPFHRGFDSGVLSVHLSNKGAPFKLFSPLLEDYLSAEPGGKSHSQASQTDAARAGNETLDKLSRTEKRLYTYLHKHTGETCEFDQLWQEVWNSPDADEKARRTIQVTVSRLRDKLSNPDEIIEPVRRRGYKLLTVGS